MGSEAALYTDVAGARRAERLVYVFMAALFIVTAVVGFAPTSSALIAAVASGERPAPPLFLHFHAVSMSFWLGLLLLMFFYGFSELLLVDVGLQGVRPDLRRIPASDNVAAAYQLHG